MTSEVVTTSGRFEVAPHSCFACGELNAVGLRLVLHVEGDTCWTETTLASDFQGWEGITHGGIIATILDEVMGWALASADSWGYTARLTIDYRHPTPIGRRLRAEGSLVERRRRLLTTRARLVDAETGELLATADALYVAAPPDRKQELKDRYRFRLVRDGDTPSEAPKQMAGGPAAASGGAATPLRRPAEARDPAEPGEALP